MVDLTVLYITANKLSNSWMTFQLSHLIKSIRSAKVVSISRKPMDLGTNIIQEGPISYWTIYMEMLRGAYLADTEFIAIAEDDVLYTESHFWKHRPPRNSVAYNRAWWALYVWEESPIYNMHQRVGNFSLIAPRDYLIDALEERKRTHPNGARNRIVGEIGRPEVDQRMGVSIRNKVEWMSGQPLIVMVHPLKTVPNVRLTGKNHGRIKAFDIPYWGKASEIVRKFNGN